MKTIFSIFVAITLVSGVWAQTASQRNAGPANTDRMKPETVKGNAAVTKHESRTQAIPNRFTPAVVPASSSVTNTNTTVRKANAGTNRMEPVQKK